ncbi:Trp biosynthesis-associated membrane protein [Citricoccus nitrophenolicus]|uniref:Putative membrane protein (TIGR02234 family) n=1 Tax=Citricoccus muralis TaxID=169134 RepID=A0A3D9L9H1_9MICC|nr:Trp biosynthesis-associated membrane protein [Citricoccus muralis]REE03008.1 putative membrane protein (TIGR02234 family) [Citricoccus muralis]
MMLKRRTAVLWAIAAGAIILGTGAQTWIESSQISGLPGDSVTTTGNEAAAVVPAMALVGMAAGIALSMARRIGRWITALLLLLAGVATVWSSVQAALDPAAAARTQVSEASGTTADAGAYAVTVWPWLTLVGGILLLLCGLAVLLFGRRWTTTRRYEAAPATGTATTAAGTMSTAGSTAGSTAASTSGEAPDTGDAEDLDEIDAWDELSRGQDPT